MVIEMQPIVRQANNFPPKYQNRCAKDQPVKADKIKHSGIFVLLYLVRNSQVLMLQAYVALSSSN